MHQPILVRPLPGSRVADTDRGVTHEIISGERRWRASQLAGVASIPAMIRDRPFADMTIAIASIDPCFSCTDRVVKVDVRSGEKSLLSKMDLEKISRAKKFAGR